MFVTNIHDRLVYNCFLWELKLEIKKNITEICLKWR
jgi:hypothetical protein